MTTPGHRSAIGFALFGSETRMNILVWLASRKDPFFYAKQYENETGRKGGSQISAAIRRLHQLGMVYRVEDKIVAHATGQRYVVAAQWYERDDTHRVWRILRVAADVLDEPVQERMELTPTRRTPEEAAALLRDVERTLRS